jgi:hypothetical protein
MVQCPKCKKWYKNKLSECPNCKEPNPMMKNKLNEAKVNFYSLPSSFTADIRHVKDDDFKKQPIKSKKDRGSDSRVESGSAFQKLFNLPFWARILIFLAVSLLLGLFNYINEYGLF